jgi:hypothetical protein
MSDQVAGPQNRTAAQYEHERAETIRLLRRVCRDHGDLDWTDELHLADIISKHLVRYLDDQGANMAGGNDYAD